MKLINKEELREKIFKIRKDLADIGLNDTEEIIEFYCGRHIDNAPEVEAIPIEWLRMWFTKKASLIGIVLMGEIESDWEKENEHKESD